MRTEVNLRESAIVKAVGEIVGLLKFPPGGQDGRLALMRLFDRIVSANPQEAVKQLQWLVETVVDNYNEWPGPQEVRAVFCTRYKPADGVEADLTAGRLAAKIEARALKAHEETKALPLPARQMLRQILPGGKLQ
ncbi:MAG: hypothetical protein E6Q97_37910 [Desulfurellales bacterium]|nr:MAG: hypothetical protein E6Q97_37910 [Desulfurellales bacterium]